MSMPKLTESEYRAALKEIVAKLPEQEARRRLLGFLLEDEEAGYELINEKSRRPTPKNQDRRRKMLRSKIESLLSEYREDIEKDDEVPYWRDDWDWTDPFEYQKRLKKLIAEYQDAFTLEELNELINELRERSEELVTDNTPDPNDFEEPAWDALLESSRRQAFLEWWAARVDQAPDYFLRHLCEKLNTREEAELFFDAIKQQIDKECAAGNDPWMLGACYEMLVRIGASPEELKAFRTPYLEQSSKMREYELKEAAAAGDAQTELKMLEAQFKSSRSKKSARVLLDCCLRNGKKAEAIEIVQHLLAADLERSPYWTQELKDVGELKQDMALYRKLVDAETWQKWARAKTADAAVPREDRACIAAALGDAELLAKIVGLKDDETFSRALLRRYETDLLPAFRALVLERLLAPIAASRGSARIHGLWAEELLRIKELPGGKEAVEAKLAHLRRTIPGWKVFWGVLAQHGLR